ncbi:MAG: DUF748 domain-containing protein [Deltaproteobacteria bacterium]|nr:DUF748 domain-containing protein [Deltaproteobacteria bacterium]
MSETENYRRRGIKGWQKTLLLALLLLFIYTLSGFFLLPWLLKTQAEKRLPVILKRSTTIDQVCFNPFTLQFKLDGFVIRARQGRAPLLKIDSLLVDFAGFLSLVNRALVLQRIDIQGPYLQIVRNEDASFNFSDLLPPPSASDKTKGNSKSEVPADKFRFSLNNITIGGGIVEFKDQARNVFHWLSDITIGLPQISNLPKLVEVHVQPAFAAVLNGAPLEIGGHSKPFSKTQETHFSINLDELDLPYYLSYLPTGRNFTVASGTLTTRLDLAYVQPENEVSRLTLSGTAQINNLLVSGQDQDQSHRFLFLPELKVAFGPGNLLQGEFFLDEIVLHQPEVNLLLRGDGLFYLPQLAATASDISAPGEPEAAPAVAEKKGEGFNFRLGRLRLNEGLVNLLDERVTPAFSARLSPVDVELDDFSTAKGELARYTLKLQSDAGETVTASGDFAIDPLILKTQFAVDNLPLSRYEAYYKDFFAGHFAGGCLHLAGELKLARNEGAEIDLQAQNLKLALADLKLNSFAGEPIFALPQFSLSQSRFDLLKRECVLGSLQANKGRLQLVRSAAEVVNLTELLPPAAADKPSADKKRATAVVAGKVAGSATALDSPPWHLLLEKGRLQDFQVDFTDFVPTTKAHIKLDQINLALDQLGNGKNVAGTCQLDLRLAEGGRLALKGPIRLAPPALELDVDLKSVSLPVLQPYLSEQLDLLLVKGAAGAEGHFSLAQGSAGKTGAAFVGKAAVENLKMVEGKRGADVLSLRKLAFTGLSLASEPPALKLRQCAVDGLQAYFIKESDGRSNLELMRVAKDVKSADSASVTLPETQTGASAVPPSGPTMALEFKKVVLGKSAVTFIDRSLSPSFKLSLSDLEGQVTGLSSLGKKPAEVKLAGQLNQQAPVAVDGFIDPLAEDLYVDLKIEGQGLEMTDLTPYSGKFVGYAIGKGKLSLDLSCKLEKQKLDTSNAIFLDQFDFGAPVASPEALKLPVKLAVALLRDRQGEIHLNLPVSGELDDPKFSLGGIIVKVFINLITKAVTSPFALISSLAGGSEELNLVTFAAGQAELDATAQDRLAKLARVLYDRPGLKVEIAGRADAVSDRQALQEEHFKNLLQVQKFKEKGGSGKDQGSLDEVMVTAAEFEHYLWQAYKAAPFAKEKNLLRMVKKIEPAEQERLLRNFVVVSDDELLLLAANRARMVMQFLSQKGPVENQRLFLVEPQPIDSKVAAEASASAEKARQVEMKIK